MAKMTKMEERIKMVKAMEYIVRQINDEEIFMSWLTIGVADGDIKYGDLAYYGEDDEAYYYAEDDDTFAELMQLFLRLMSAANKDGGLYCGNVVSR